MGTAHITVLLVLFFCGSLSAQSGWEKRKAVWEPILGIKSDISIMIGGDINGDDRDDIVVIYKSGPNRGLTVLMTEGEGYRPVRFNDQGLDFLKNADITNASQAGLVNGKIELFMPLDLKKILPSVQSNGQAALTFSYAGPFRQILLENITAPAVLSDEGVSGGIPILRHRTSHIFYNVRTSRLFWKTLVLEEQADRPGSFESACYHRFIAKRLDDIKMDAGKSEDEWLSVSYPVLLRNAPEGNFLNSGFGAWKGDHDLSAWIYTGYNAGYFFLYAHVVDDAVDQDSPGSRMAGGDHLVLRFAAAGSDELHMALSPGNFSTVKPEAYLWKNGRKTGLNKKLSQAVLASRRAVDGYVIEAKIPAGYLPSGFIGSSVSLFSVTISDRDGPGIIVKELSSSPVKGTVPHRLGRIFWE